MESTLILIIGIIAALLVLVLVFKVLGFGLKIITNPKFLLAALLICVAAFVIMKLR
ncbi:MAG: hypothetical protein IJH28_06425 [Mogibacterium sp.]|nr:hypothetical protein [Mogibacterium sp.]